MKNLTVNSIEILEQTCGYDNLKFTLTPDFWWDANKKEIVGDFNDNCYSKRVDSVIAPFSDLMEIYKEKLVIFMINPELGGIKFYNPNDPENFYFRFAVL